MDEDLLIEGRALKVGKRLAFLEAEIRRKEDGKVLVKGSHTKYMDI